MKEHWWPFHQWSQLRFQSRCQSPERCAKTCFCQSRRRWFFPFRTVFAFRGLFAFLRLLPFRNCVPLFRWFHTRVTAGFLRFANGATRLRCAIVATVYGPERVKEPRLE